MTIRLFCFICFVLLFGHTSVYAQKQDQLSRQEAESIYQSLNEKVDPNLSERLLLANASYVVGDFDEALQHIQFLINSGKKSYSAEAFYLNGQIAMMRSAYENAIELFKRGLENDLAPTKRKDIVRLIRQSEAAVTLINDDVSVSPLTGINSINDDWRPVWSDNHWNNFYYSLSTPDKETLMFKGQLEDETQISHVEPLVPLFDYVSNIVDNGSYMFSVDRKGTINRLDTATNNTIITDIPYDVTGGDCCIQILSDDAAVFASNRNGGHGGYDLFLVIRHNDRWLPPKNMGATINSEYNDLDPWLSIPTGTLYFSSDRIKSAGGLDIFNVKLDYEKKYWEAPTNLGLGINSAGDDRFPSLREDGYALLFSSNRNPGTGGFDLFLSYLSKIAPDRVIDFELLYQVIYKQLSHL